MSLMMLLQFHVHNFCRMQHLLWLNRKYLSGKAIAVAMLKLHIRCN